MIWDPIWEQVFWSRDWGKYPPEELIRFVARNYYAAPDHAQVGILEVGAEPERISGTCREKVLAPTGSMVRSMAIEKTRQRLKEESLAASLEVGDATVLKKIFSVGVRRGYRYRLPATQRLKRCRGDSVPDMPCSETRRSLLRDDGGQGVLGGRDRPGNRTEHIHRYNRGAIRR